MIEARDVWKVYADGHRSTEVLKGINLHVEKGETVAILGPSGAGKSTLLHLLSGMDRPTRGEIFLRGEPLQGMGDRARSIILNRTVGFVFQFYHLIEDLTVLENVMLPSIIRPRGPRGEARRYAEAILKEVGLEALGHRFPMELSGGEKQRVAIARALMNKPEILFCDEPTGNLDSQTGQEIQRYLKTLAQSDHKTVLIVTHDDKIAREAGRVMKLKDGRWAD